MSRHGRLPDVAVRLRAKRRIETRHPWVYGDDVAASDGAAHGDLVRVRDNAGMVLGFAFWSSRSKIALRMLSLAADVPDAAFWASRVDEALARRGAAIARWPARRLVFGEGDGVPGLIADLYGTHLVIQALTAGTERIVEEVVAALRDRLAIDSVLLRNDSSVRTLEGLSREVRQLSGTTPETIVVDEEGVRYTADPWHGQKTGAFLDQRENRVASRAYGRGRVLDAFSYHASFALHAALSATEVVVVDSSAEALARGRSNADLNGATNLSFVEANAFEDLRDRDRRGERFDLVLLDPPAFAKSRSDVAAARRGYKEINLRAFRLLAPGGVLVTSSCSYNLDEPSFEGLLREAAADAGRDAVVIDRRGQAADHPVRLAFPEGRYLKCFVLRDASGTP
jgi:23S rRNA (cytosine1962-C5)-methyltransferase